MNLFYRLIYNRYLNFYLRWINRLLSPLLPSGIRIPPSGIIQVDTGTSRFSLQTNQTSYLTWKLFWSGPSSFEYSALFPRLIQNAEIFFDVGANIGYYSLMACAENPILRVFSFEPAKGSAAYLEQNIRLNDMEQRIRCERLALHDKEEELTFQEITNDKYPFTEHVLSGENHASTKITQRESRSYAVPAMTLDHYCQAHNIQRVDLIKIDTEGSETNILMGGAATIERFHPVIICELLYHVQEEQIESVMKAHGYEFYLFREGQLVKTNTLQRQSDDGVRDCFFIHPDRRDLAGPLL